MKTYVVEVERTERDSFALTVPALPGLLILGLSIDDVLERARAAIEFLCRRRRARSARATGGCTRADPRPVRVDGDSASRQPYSPRYVGGRECDFRHGDGVASTAAVRTDARPRLR